MLPSYRGSQLKLRRQCGHAYHQEYVVREPGLPSPALRGGQNVHDAVAGAARKIVSGDPFIDVHALAFEAVRGGGIEYADALRVLTRFQEAVGTEFSIDRKAVFLIEERLAMPLTLWDGTEVLFTGVLDLAQRVGQKTVAIDDWKTHWRPMTKEQCEADPQLRRYALLVKHHYPAFEEFILVRRFIRYRENFHREVITADELPAVENALISEIQATREKDAAGDFEATGGSWCALCAHHATCPLIARYREQGIDWLSIADDQVARSMASDLMALDGARDRIRTQLKRYLGAEHATGAVPVVGGELGYHATEQREIAPTTLRETLEGKGVEMPEDLLTVDLQALDRFVKKLPEAASQAVQKAIRRSQGTRFAFQRHPAESTVTDTPATEPGELFD